MDHTSACPLIWQGMGACLALQNPCNPHDCWRYGVVLYDAKRTCRSTSNGVRPVHALTESKRNISVIRWSWDA